MLRVIGLTAERNEKVLFSNLTFKLDPGSLGLIKGPNGSGKSTLLKMIAGLISSEVDSEVSPGVNSGVSPGVSYGASYGVSPGASYGVSSGVSSEINFSEINPEVNFEVSSEINSEIRSEVRSDFSSEEGSIFWNNQPIQQQRTSFNHSLLYLGHQVGLQPALSILENLRWLLSIHPKIPFTTKDTTKEITKETMRETTKEQENAFLMEVLETLGLKSVLEKPCATLSHGQKMKVALARLWFQNAKIWILDEPFTGLDHTSKQVVENKLTNYLAQGGIIVMAVHDTVRALQTWVTTEISL